MRKGSTSWDLFSAKMDAHCGGGPRRVSKTMSTFSLGAAVDHHALQLLRCPIQTAPNSERKEVMNTATDFEPTLSLSGNGGNTSHTKFGTHVRHCHTRTHSHARCSDATMATCFMVWIAFRGRDVGLHCLDADSKNNSSEKTDHSMSNGLNLALSLPMLIISWQWAGFLGRTSSLFGVYCWPPIVRVESTAPARQMSRLHCC